MKPLLVIIGSTLAVAGCGSEDVTQPKTPPATRTSAEIAPSSQRAEKKKDLIVFRRVRYEGATLRTMYLHADGTINVDVPNGGAGGAKFESILKPRAFRAIRRTIETTPWRHLSRRKVQYDASGAYFMMRRAGHDYVAMSAGMSRDLVPVVDRLNDVLNGEGIAKRKVVHRFLNP